MSIRLRANGFAGGGLVIAALATAPLARAQGNYRSAALGGRSALMGNTGIANGTDSAAPLLNPATTTRVQSALALSVNFFLIDFNHASHWYVPGPVDAATYGSVSPSGADINRIAGNTIPSTFCFFLGLPRLNDDTEGRKGIQKVAFCLGTTELQQFDWSGQGFQSTSGVRSVTQASSVRRGWQRFVVTPSYAVNVTDRLALGVSLHGAVSTFSFLNEVGTTTGGGPIPSTSTAFEYAAGGASFEISTMVGATYTRDRLTLGATIQSPDISIVGHGNVSSYVQLPNATVSSSTYIGQGSYHSRWPTRFGSGIAYKWPSGTTLEIDGTFALADGDALDLTTQGTALSGSGATKGASSLHLYTRYKPTFNASLGAEIFFNSRFSLLTGLATDLSSIDTPAADSIAMTRLDRVIGSIGFGSHSSEGGTLLLGMQGYYGWGDALAPNAYATPATLSPTSSELVGVVLVLGGTTDVKAIEQAVNAVKSVVAPKAAPVHLPDQQESEKKDVEEQKKEEPENRAPTP